MTPEQEIQQLKQRLDLLEQLVKKLWRNDRWVFENPIVGGTRGLQLNQTGGKVGFNGKTPLTIWSSGVGKQDVNGDSGLPANRGTQYTGNTGTSAYSVGDIVAALKAYGLVA